MLSFFFPLVHCQLCTFDLLSIHEEQFGSFCMYVSIRIDWLIHQFKELSLQLAFVFSLFQNKLSLQHFIILEFWALFGIMLECFILKMNGEELVWQAHSLSLSVH